jgi:hypothetical protein
MVGMMANNMNQKKVVKGHGMKGRWHKVELKALEDLIALDNAGWKIIVHLMFAVCTVVPH